MDEMLSNLLRTVGHANNLQAFVRLLSHEVLFRFGASQIVVWHHEDDGEFNKIAEYCSTGPLESRANGDTPQSQENLLRVLTTKRAYCLPLGSKDDVIPFDASSKIRRLYIPLDGFGIYVGVLEICFSIKDGTDALSTDNVAALQIATESIYWRTRNIPGEKTKSTSTRSVRLTERQLVVLDLMREQLTNRQIALRMNLSESSVKQETIRIYRFLNVNSRHDALRLTS
jgi:DNA-binding CsgD family transcriptional regulator